MRTVIDFRLKKRLQISDLRVVPRFLSQLCHRPALRFGLARDSRGRYRNTQFASFLAESNRSPSNIDLHGVIMRTRKIIRHALIVLLCGGAIWVVVESAKALTMY